MVVQDSVLVWKALRDAAAGAEYPHEHHHVLPGPALRLRQHQGQRVKQSNRSQ